MSKKVVIIGAGFGGLAVARSLTRTDTKITLIDKNNHHLFLPLLYQVASAALLPSDVAFPIRDVLHGQKNIRVIMDEVEEVDITARQVRTINAKYDYDYLIVASGLRSSYFGRDEWEVVAPSMKTLGDAIKIREKILLSFKKAERIISDAECGKYLTFVIVGGGPTGVEIAGAIAGIRRGRSKYFEQVQQKHIRIILLEALDRLLGGFSGDLSSKGHKALEQLGVEVRLNVKITGISTNGVQTDGGFIETENIIWAAGARAQLFTQSMGFESDKIGRIIVDNYCSVPGHPDVFIIGDTAVYKDGQKTLPSLASVAIQQGNFVAGIIKSDMSCKARKPFKYKNKGSIAIIGRHRAVLQYGKLKMSGYLAWLIWIILHFFLVSRIRTKGIDAVRLLFHYLNECKGTRLIAGE